MEKKKPQTSDDTIALAPAAAVSHAAIQATPQFLFSAQIAATQQMSGPLPPPEVLRQYEQINPGLLNRIVKMAEDEAAHRRESEKEAIAIQGRDQIAYRRSELLGQIFGLAIGITALVCAVIMALHGAQWAASIIGGGGVTGLVTAFILGRNFLLKQRSQEFQQQMQAAELQRSAGSHAK